MSKLLISIGISEYENKIFSTLPGAKNDALRVASFFNLWGIDKKNIVLLTDKSATKDTILKTIRVETLRQEETVDTIYIYYAGHGEINKENPRQPENILYCYDTKLYDKVGTGITISELIDGIERCKPKRIFLFLDACYVQITEFPPFYLDAEKIGSEKRCFFALISTWGKETREKIDGGEFTTLLLKGFAYLRNSDPICTDLAAYVEEKAIEAALPEPKGYWIGSSNTWFFDSLIKNYSCILDGKRYVNRYDSLISITDTILLNGSGKLFCFYGGAKSGKTILALELTNYFPFCFYYSVDSYSSMEQIKDGLAQCILNGINNRISYLNVGCNDLTAAIALIVHLKLSITIIIDHAERLEKTLLDDILKLVDCDNITVAAFSRTPLISAKYVFFNTRFPNFSMCEFNEFIVQQEPKLNLPERTKRAYYNTYKNRPQEFLQRLLNFTEDDVFSKCKNEIFYLCQCDGFVDIDCFISAFKLNKEHIFHLINCGLIRKEKDYYLPHESLFEYYDYNKNAVLKSTNAETYWINQILSSPYNNRACTLMLKLVEQKGIDWLESNKSNVTKILMTYCIDHHDWKSLELVLHYLIKIKDIHSILKAGTELAHVAKGIILEIDSEVSVLFPQDMRFQWNIIKSEVLFWKGEFNASIALSQKLISKSINTLSKQNVFLNLGIAHFFLGNWKDSEDALDRIVTKDKRIDGWKKLIIGTIYAIRGVNFNNGVSLLNSCIENLKAINDVVGLGIAYVNLGECYYKKGMYSSAYYYLELGESYTILSHDDATELEMLRNKLMVYLADNHVFDADANTIEQSILDKVAEVNDKTELMQVYNSLATAAAYKYDITGLRNYIKKAKTLTEGNLEYGLYTILNELLLAYIESNQTVVNELLSTFYSAAILGENYFAIRQCINIIEDISVLFSIDSLSNQSWLKMKGAVMNNSIIFKANTPQEVIIVDEFINQMAIQDGFEFHAPLTDTRGIEEIILTIIGSSALVVLANAVRDLVQKKKIHISMRLNDGTTLDITEEGKEISSDEIVGYLSNSIHKDVTEEVNKEIKQRSFDVSLKIDKE